MSGHGSFFCHPALCLASSLSTGNLAAVISLMISSFPLSLRSLWGTPTCRDWAPVFWPSMSMFLLCFLSIFCFIFWETKMFLPGVKEYFFLDEWHYGNSNFTSEPGLSLWYHWHFRVTLCHGNYLVHWRMFSRIPGLYLLDTNSTVPSRPNQKCPQTLLISGQDP